MKKIISITLFVLTLFTFAACGKKEVPNVPVKDIMESILKEADVGMGMEVDFTDSEQAKQFEINPEEVEEGLGKFSMVNINADSIAVIKAKDEEKAKVIEGKLKEYVDKQAKNFQDYLPEEFDKIQKNILKTKGNYVFFAVSDNAEKAEEIFDNALK